MKNKFDFKKVKIHIPSRLHLDVMNIQKLIEGQVGGGGIGIAIDTNFTMSIEVIDAKEDIIECIKPKLVEFYLKLLKKFFKINLNFKVTCEPNNKIKTHSGMGSNAAVQLGVVYAVNYLLNSSLTSEEIIKFLQENYYEEDDNKITNRIYCSGVAHNTIMYGGVSFTSEDGELIYSKNLPSNVKVGILNADLKEIFEEKNVDKDELVVNLRKIRDRKFGIKNKEDIIKNKIIKDLERDNYLTFINEMKYFSKEDDSVALSEKCKVKEFSFQEFCELIEGVDNTFVRVSSNSPYICIITSNMNEVKTICNKNDIKLEIYDIDNKGINIIEEG